MAAIGEGTHFGGSEEDSDEGCWSMFLYGKPAVHGERGQILLLGARADILLKTYI